MQHSGNERAVCEVFHLGVEGQDVEEVYAQVCKCTTLLIGGHQPKGRRIGLEYPARMRIEADHTAGRAQVFRGLHRQGNYALMAQVHPVEIAERNAGPTVGLYQSLPAMHDTHRLSRPFSGP